MKEITKSHLKKFLKKAAIYLFFGVLPLLLTFLILAMADFYDCNIGGSGPITCSNKVWDLVFAYWLAMITVPAALIGIVSEFIIFIVRWLREK